MNRLLTLLAIILCSTWLSSCGLIKTELDKCHEQREYQAAKPGPRLRVPDDLEGPAEEAWVPIPYGEVKTTATPEDDPCLIEPPEFRTEQPN